MKFHPKSEHEIEAENLLPNGIYDFEVAQAKDEVSKKGNDMIKIALKVFAPNGGTPFVYDYLLEAFLSKLLNFCATTGMEDAYNAGELSAEMCMGRCGKVEIGTEAKTGFKPKNVVRDYIKPVVKTKPSDGITSAASGDLEDDDIPF